MNKEEALEKYDSFYTTDEINNFIKKIYKDGFIITKSEPALKIHIEAIALDGITKEFIQEKIVPEIIEALKLGVSNKELKNALL